LEGKELYRILMQALTVTALLGALLLGWGCAGIALSPAAAPAAPPAPGPEALERGWWAVRFRFAWPPEAEPSWHLDPLFAHRVALPVLERHREGILVWRFHRRAARDDAGHQFSLIFYADRLTAARVNAEILEDPLVREAETAGRLKKVVCEDPTAPLSAGIGDRSDPAWPPALRDAWPHFLMGASRTWLELVTKLAASGPAESGGGGFSETEERYRRLNAAVTAVWQQEGRHAFLHHLNALFGYEPIWIIDRRLMTF
jgi:hypothetical protein